jgi:hypothetical protein
VLAAWRRCIAHAYAPEHLYARFRHQCDVTYVNRLVPPARGKLKWPVLRQGVVLAWRLLMQVGIRSDYRREFWKAAGYAIRRGQIDAAFGMGFVSHHLIRFSREALRGQQNASFYSTREREQAERVAA